MRAAPSAQERAGEVDPSPGDQPALSTTPVGDPLALFWHDVAAGRVRLSPAEDQIVWDLRAAHWRWDFIARHLLRRRSDATARMARARDAMQHNAAKRWRDQYRRNKGEQR